jgi:hypothetical protein
MEIAGFCEISQDPAIFIFEICQNQFSDEVKYVAKLDDLCIK